MSVMESINVVAKDTPDQGTGDTTKQKVAPVEKLAGIAVFDKTSKRMQVYDTNEKIWTIEQVFDDDMMKNGFSAVVLNEQLYVFLQNKNVYRIAHSDPDATWEKRARKTLAIGPVVVLDGMAYTLNYTFKLNNRMERFNPTLNKWQILPNKTLDVFCAPLAVAEGKIFVIGGRDSTRRIRTEVEMFDATTSSWTLDIPLSRARFGSSTVTVENKVYVLGGTDATDMTDSVEYRCPKSEAWIMIPPMKKPRQVFSSCCIGGRIYVVGGDTGTPQTIEEYDPEKNEWKVVCEMKRKYIEPLASVALPL